MKLWSLLVAIGLFWAGLAQAEERIALVLGNSQYTAVTPLDNATNDSSLIAASLRTVGFDVMLVQDATQVEMRTAIADFGRKLRAAGPDTVGLFYYAGHGIQSFGSNYLLPVDASLTNAADLDLVAMEASSVLRQMASARNKTNIVIFDACRNNPFEDIADLNDNGLAEMKAPLGTYLAYATAPGAVALDGLEGNSPFTASLATAIQKENAPIEAVFKDVRVDVIAQTQGFQTPWDTSSLTQDFVFKASKPLTAEEVAESQLWDSVKGSEDPVQIMLFLRSYPDGLFHSDARQVLSVLMQDELKTDEEEAPVVEAPKPQPVPDQEVVLMEAARSSGEKADYQAYLDAFPDVIFAELVKIEIAGIEAKEEALKVAAAPQAEPEPKPEPETVVLPEPEEPLPVFFAEPMKEGVPEIVGKTILEAANGSPLFPPIEGLPESMWKDQECKTCHQWDRTSLCTQAVTYLNQNAERALSKQHPYGGSFKRNLRNWAKADCQ